MDAGLGSGEQRIVDRGVYLGPIATIGVSNDFKYHTNLNGISTDYQATGNVSESLGIEAGAKFAIFRFGAEAGISVRTTW